MNTNALSGVCAVVAHDAGGAEVVSSYVRRQMLSCLYALEGPARKVFGRKLGDIETISVEEAMRKANWVLCGTSWQSELEFNAIKLARATNKHSVAFLDHWGNYMERFERAGEICLPDEIWVGDGVALGMGKKIFPYTPIRLVENPYFMDVREEIRKCSVKRFGDSGELVVLYICEPVSEHALRQHGDERHWGYTEEDALRYFFSNIDVLGRPVDRILIRPHPSEASGKYDWVKESFDLPIEMGGARSLLEEIADSDVLVGCSSMAMVIGLQAGKRVISCIPPGGKPCALPQPEIEIMQELC